jgi:hypothetical protein
MKVRQVGLLALDIWAGLSLGAGLGGMLGLVVGGIAAEFDPVVVGVKFHGLEPAVDSMLTGAVVGMASMVFFAIRNALRSRLS